MDDQRVQDPFNLGQLNQDQLKPGQSHDRVNDSMTNNTSTCRNDLPRRQSVRQALTLAEVLIAMGILTVGLLGVASIFPVGGFYMQSGDIADQGGAIAQAALEDAIIRGHLDPENWVVHDVNATGSASGQFMSLIDGVVIRGNGTKQARVGLRQAPSIAVGSSPYRIGAASTNDSEQYKATLLGGAYVIDPYGLAGALDDPNLSNQLVVNAPFNHNVRRFPAFFNRAAPQSTLWAPWMVTEESWPVRRLTTVHQLQQLNGSASFKLQIPTARQRFVGSDDLATTLPDDDDAPARQQYETWVTGGNAFASRRLSRGDYSWIITIDFGSSRVRDGMATRPDAYPVEVSVAVFHKRFLGRGFESTVEAERLVEARVVSAGPSGGEMLLQRRINFGNPSSPTQDDDPAQLTSPFEDLREGQYVMVVGPHPLSTDAAPRLALRWCRVLNLREQGAPNLNGTTQSLSKDTQVLAALRGADWPWQPATSLNDNAALSNDLRVAILPGVVAVHTKTMRLEAGSEWSID